MKAINIERASGVFGLMRHMQFSIRAQNFQFAGWVIARATESIVTSRRDGEKWKQSRAVMQIKVFLAQPNYFVVRVVFKSGTNEYTTGQFCRDLDELNLMLYVRDRPVNPPEWWPYRAMSTTAFRALWHQVSAEMQDLAQPLFVPAPSSARMSATV